MIRKEFCELSQLFQDESFFEKEARLYYFFIRCKKTRIKQIKSKKYKRTADYFCQERFL
jgi:hypothetical protein